MKIYFYLKMFGTTTGKKERNKYISPSALDNIQFEFNFNI